MVVTHSVLVRPGIAARDNKSFPDTGVQSPEQFYTALGCSYPKFYKMDNLCKWAFLASEYLLGADGATYTGIDKNKIAVAIGTSHGCLEADRRYFETISMPSPAMFVYTLPNIMLGEICIRHGFKGEQSCMVSERFDAEELYFNVHRFLMHGDMDACLCGWADVTPGQHDVCLFWIAKSGAGINFSSVALHHMYTKRN